MNDDPVAQAYVELLAREPWHWFVTLTFSPQKNVRDKWTGELRKVDRFHPIHGMHLEAANKAFRYLVRSINENLYGKRWMRVPHGGLVWARGQEFHRSGKVHFHALFAAPDVDLNTATSRYYWHEFWYREFGRNQIERPRDQDDVLGYVSKYVTQEGEVDFSPNFGQARPPQIFTVEQDRMAGNRNNSLMTLDTSIGRPGDKDQGEPPAFLSLTLPVRLKSAQSMFTEETFFITPEETPTCASPSTTTK